MKNILHNAMLAAIWFAGAVFFFFLVIYNVISFFANGLRRAFKWKGLYNFREHEFPALNVICDSAKNILVGKLPTSEGEIHTYHVPLIAKEILLEFKFTTSADSCVELDYCLSSNNSTFRKEFVYIFMNPFSDSMNVNYNNALLWYPLPEDRILKVQFTDIKSANTVTSMEGQLYVVQVR